MVGPVEPCASAVGLLPHPDRDDRGRAGSRTPSARLAAHGIDVRCPADRWSRHDLDPDGLDVVISLGGDGTMLRAVDLVYEAGVPVLGVNVGQLGYLTEVEPDDFDAALDRLLAGDYEVAERMVLEVTVESAGSAQGRWFALNEAVLEKLHTGQLVRLDVDDQRHASSRRTRPTA